LEALFDVLNTDRGQIHHYVYTEPRTSKTIINNNMKAVNCSYQIRVKIGRWEYGQWARLWVGTRIQSGNL